MEKPQYFIGIDTYDKESKSYCMIKKHEESYEIVLCKTIRDENEFEEEVKNLARYFDAVTIREGDVPVVPIPEMKLDFFRKINDGKVFIPDPDLMKRYLLQDNSKFNIF